MGSCAMYNSSLERELRRGCLPHHQNHSTTCTQDMGMHNVLGACPPLAGLHCPEGVQGGVHARKVPELHLKVVATSGHPGPRGIHGQGGHLEGKEGGREGGREGGT